ncbi:HsdM family class I SAM-dependent methyltransferase [Nodularia sphaerocarpa]|uniref:HsdM family class I SAM-dependent methyltransferase n=1 Tax=Nodularia sphaerocarpa TaxID=137816 RepID=UPI001EFB99A9|nr:class I SAM-dependent DNA methyltransferase [Nodularia sphaerocarpa]MDB9374755.1 class I SAM-dependent DNA methyltransferase [Nodularia sphaerocarpa CS-585]MDB9378349.1 class I SAM-dependent DNA methyltransferase [Nodularia sphaerocarpa CS-585A2]ULP70589.1 putative type I restriction enzymeP M protein [Nodularia sphaerocarpa UHCC 0038]
MITLQDLQRELWSASEILRADFSVSDYNKYLLRLLFLKHLSDVFEERAEGIEQTRGNRGLAWNKQKDLDLFVPECSRWSYLQCVDKNIGDALNIASKAIEYKNPHLERIFTSIDFENQHNYFASEENDKILRQLIKRFSYISLGYSKLAEPDILGKACEYLIEKSVVDAGKAGGAFYTPDKIAKLLVHLLGIEKGMRICDPVCGVGGFLVEYANYIKQMGLNLENVSFYGQEINLETWVMAKINLLLHGIFDCDIRLGDTIRDPQLLKDRELMLFDRVIANPPFNLKNWGYERDGFDVYYRFRYGVPPKSNGDFAFIQHILATLEKTGKAAIIVVNGVLFRGGNEGLIRQRIIKEDLIEAVISLAPNLFYYTSIPSDILIFNRYKLEKHKNKVLFIDASSKYEKIGNQNYLQSEHITDIVTGYQDFTDKEGYAKVVSLQEIADNDYILNINRYVLPPKSEKDKLDIEAEIIKLRQLEAERVEAENEMNRYLGELGVKL